MKIQHLRLYGIFAARFFMHADQWNFKWIKFIVWLEQNRQRVQGDEFCGSQDLQAYLKIIDRATLSTLIHVIVACASAQQFSSCERSVLTQHPFMHQKFSFTLTSFSHWVVLTQFTSHLRALFNTFCIITEFISAEIFVCKFVVIFYVNYIFPFIFNTHTKRLTSPYFWKRAHDKFTSIFVCFNVLILITLTCAWKLAAISYKRKFVFFVNRKKHN